MNKLRFKGTRNGIKGKLREKYGNLTDDDLAYSEGQDEELNRKNPEATRENAR
ncbi:MAG: CsbD family protein [Chthoniobacterales bacterium]